YQRELSENRLAHYFGVWQGECLLAFGGFWQILDEGHITNVAAHPDYRRLGLAQLLITHMMTACRALGGRTMTLEVRENNAAARRLYEKMGFGTAGIRPHYYDNGENAVIMWSRL
ncbi:MAG: ribosomal protein S18-alanine N-acetyltransferase, partial [Clostridiales bacterium]|nr:ribosomal protein S18-alanine N-acetyltransferase [Clostridiales bacterium]